MTGFLRSLVRRVAAIVALVLAVMAAALFASLALAVALATGAMLWVATRFGLRATRAPDGPGLRRDHDVIDVEMREIEPGAGNDPARAPTAGASADRPKD